MKQTISRAIWGALRGACIIATRGAILFYLIMFVLIQSNRLEYVTSDDWLPSIIFLTIWIFTGIIYSTVRAISEATRLPTQEPMPTVWTVIKYAFLVGITTMGWTVIAGCVIRSIELTQESDDMAGIWGYLIAASAPIIGLIGAMVGATSGFAYKEAMETQAGREAL